MAKVASLEYQMFQIVRNKAMHCTPNVGLFYCSGVVGLGCVLRYWLGVMPLSPSWILLVLYQWM